jgi:hypothetical protein
MCTTLVEGLGEAWRLRHAVNCAVTCDKTSRQQFGLAHVTACGHWLPLFTLTQGSCSIRLRMGSTKAEASSYEFTDIVVSAWIVYDSEASRIHSELFALLKMECFPELCK